MKKVSREALIRGVGLVLPVVRAIARKERKPTEADLILIRGLRDEVQRANKAQP